MFDFPIRQMHPSEGLDHEMNWRLHPEMQLAELARSLTEHGWLDCPIFNVRTGRYIDGHARRRVALQKGETSIPVRLVDVDETEERRLLVEIDWLGELAEEDENVRLRLLSDELSSAGDVPLALLLLAQEARLDLPAFDPEPAGGDPPYNAPTPPADPAQATQAVAAAVSQNVVVMVPTSDYDPVMDRLYRLADHYGVDNVSDAVLEVLRDADESQL